MHLFVVCFMLRFVYFTNFTTAKKFHQQLSLQNHLLQYSIFRSLYLKNDLSCRYSGAYTLLRWMFLFCILLSGKILRRPIYD